MPVAPSAGAIDLSSRTVSRATLLLALALTVGTTIAVFWPVLSNGFLLYDDGIYVYDNPPVRQGLTWAGARWAFTSGYAANWHPLTWLSHMADVQMFGLRPRGHHLTSLLLHAANAALLLLLLQRLTGSVGRSTAVALLFAIHPTRVESVAWVAERKDVLCVTFGLLAMGAYASWTRRRGSFRYALALTLFALGLMAKPMLVTLPLLLLLLDVWPLRRLSPLVADPASEPLAAEVLRGCVVEKIPFLALSLASSVVTFVVQRTWGAVTLDLYPLPLRVENALVSTVTYLRQVFWPSDLAVFHPHPDAYPLWAPLAAAGLLAGLTVLAWRLRARSPYLIVGWLWFLIALLPVVGLVQVGWQGRAERYTYLPFIGLFVGLVWGAGDLVDRARSPWSRRAAVAAFGAILLAFGAATRTEALRWRDTATLFTRALEVTGENDVAHYMLGRDLLSRGHAAEAEAHLREALRIRPSDTAALEQLGGALVVQGRIDEAAAVFAETVRRTPDSATALNNLASLRLRQGEVEQAIELYRAAAERAPGMRHVPRALATALLLDGQTAEAVRALEQALRLDPSQVEWRADLEGARALLDPGQRSSPAARRLRLKLAALQRDVAAALAQRGRHEAAQAHLKAAGELDLSEAKP
jgi:protein O-mannosyl-transferase